MKRTLQAIISACILCGSALAIPQNFNGGFFGAAGQRFEDFAIAALGPGAELKGKWIAVAKQEGKLRLAVDAVVFGIPASETFAITAIPRVPTDFGLRVVPEISLAIAFVTPGEVTPLLATPA